MKVNDINLSLNLLALLRSQMMKKNEKGKRDKKKGAIGKNRNLGRV